MLKKTLLTAAAALAITTGAGAISAPDANAGVKFHTKFGHGHNGFFGDYFDGYFGPTCFWKKKRVKISFWHHGHKHRKWVWRSFRVCH